MKNRGLQGNRDADGNLVTAPAAGEFPLEEKQYSGGADTPEDAMDDLFNDAPESIKEMLKGLSISEIEDLVKYMNSKLMNE